MLCNVKCAIFTYTLFYSNSSRYVTFKASTYVEFLIFHFNFSQFIQEHHASAVFSGGAGGARAPPEFRGSQKGRSLISAYQSLAITTNTPGFEKLNTALGFRNMSEKLIFFSIQMWLIKIQKINCSAEFSFSNLGVFVVIAKLW